MSARSESHRSFKTWLFAPAAMVGVVPLSGAGLARTRMMVDMAKITCRQYLFDRTISPEAPRIATWLSGYFNGKRNNTMVDIGTIRSNKDKVEDYCRMNQDVTIMDAARTALGLDKQ